MMRILILIGLFSGSVLQAELKPDEIAILVSAESKESRLVADHYIKARSVPKENVIEVSFPKTEVLDRKLWESESLPAIRRWLEQNDPNNKIRCIVTTYDVPLKIGQAGPQFTEEIRTAIAKEKTVRVKRTLEVIQQLDQFVEKKQGEAADTPIDQLKAQDLVARFEKSFRAAYEKAQADKEHIDYTARNGGLERSMLATAGLSSWLASFGRTDPNTKPTPERAQQLGMVNGQNVALREGIEALSGNRETGGRVRQMLHLLDRTDGYIGSIRFIETLNDVLNKNESYASLDSELSIVLWDDFPLMRWLPNTLYMGLDGTDIQSFRRTLMVSRLEAPTLELTLRLIDQAIETERSGLKGRIYLDARGIPRPAQQPRGSYGDYDESLREFHQIAKAVDLDVVLDNEDKLFAEGDCPDAALYCGWYSLGNYVDAFDWSPGSIGYHLASSEAYSLRDPNSNVWCKKMLEDGVCATIGPVYEPYLAAFPRPDEFFPLVLTGELTLVESYYRTMPMVSWVMVLVGDPLYNPYKGRSPWGDRAPPTIEKLLPKSGAPKLFPEEPTQEN